MKSKVVFVVMCFVVACCALYVTYLDYVETLTDGSVMRMAASAIAFIFFGGMLAGLSYSQYEPVPRRENGPKRRRRGLGTAISASESVSTEELPGIRLVKPEGTAVRHSRIRQRPPMPKSASTAQNHDRRFRQRNW